MAYPTYLSRAYSGKALGTFLSAAGLSSSYVTSPAQTFTVLDASSWKDIATGNPLGADGSSFVVAIDYGGANEEKVLCSSISGNVVTVWTDGTLNGRAYDGTLAQTHAANALCVPVYTATEADEANFAVVNTVGRIGYQGDLLVGTGSHAMSALAKGLTGQVLTVGATTLGWATPYGVNPAGRMYQSTTGTTVATGTMASYPTGLGTSLTNMVQDFVNGGMTFSGTGASAGTLTVPAGGGGIYMVSAAILWATMAGGNVVTSVVKNGTTAVGQWISNPSATGGTFLQASGVTLVSLAAGDTLTLSGKHNNASSQVTNPGSSITYLSAALVSK